MRGRKGDGSITTNNVISVIIAVIGIVLLGYGIWKLYDAVANNEAKNAQKTLDNLMEKISTIKQGEEAKFLLRGVKDWFIVGFDKDDQIRPDKCYFESCVCICPGLFEIHDGEVELFFNSAKTQCQSEGFCRSVSDIDSVSVSRIYNGDDVNTGVFGYINLKSNLAKMRVVKGNAGDKKMLYIIGDIYKK